MWTVFSEFLNNENPEAFLAIENRVNLQNQFLNDGNREAFLTLRILLIVKTNF